MKKNINPLGPNANAKLDALKKRLSNGAIVPNEFLKELRAVFGDELYDSTYTSWRGLKQRAQKLHAEDGVPLSPEFQKFHSFVACMGLRPSRLYTLDRVNGALGYSAANCRWADKKAQTRNRATTVYATDRNGQTQTLAEWAEIKGTSLKTLSKRKNENWSDIDIINGRTPAPANTKSTTRHRPYGSSARFDYSPSGRNWPPRLQNAWEIALADCDTWIREDKIAALDFAETRRNYWTQRQADFVEMNFVPDDEDDGQWTPSERDQAILANFEMRIRYFQDWLERARRAMFPASFIPPDQIW